MPGQYLPDQLACCIPAMLSGGGERATGTTTVRCTPKVRYWEVTGDRRERRELTRLVAWPSLSWKTLPPPGEGVTDG